jgi:hypothetical protein
VVINFLNQIFTEYVGGININEGKEGIMNRNNHSLNKHSLVKFIVYRKFLWLYGCFRIGDKYEVIKELDQIINKLPIIISPCVAFHD